MESNVKQHTLVFDKGLTNSPSDLLCDDDSLEVCEGMTMVDGEWKAIQRPLEFEGYDRESSELMLVHHGDAYTHYIFKTSIPQTTNYVLSYTDLDTQTIGTIEPLTTNEMLSVKAVGNTLIVNTAEGLRYYLWGADSDGEMKYKSLGSKIPFPNVDLYMDAPEESTKSLCITGMVSISDTPVSEQSSYNDAIVGLYAGAKKKLQEDKRFVNPFFARYAIELYDGSYTYASAPILMLPSIHRSAFFEWYTQGKNSYPYAKVFVYGCPMHYYNWTDYTEWSDIVRGVSVFVTRETELFSTSSDCTFDTSGVEEGDLLHDHLSSTNGTDDVKYQKHIVGGETLEHAPLDPLPLNDEATVISNLESESVYYLLANLGTQTGGGKLDSKIKKNTIVNIETQTQLSNGDYYSRCILSPSNIDTFNRRLNMWGVKRGFYEGFGRFEPYTSNSSVTYGSQTYDIYVYIKTSSGVRIAKRTAIYKDILHDNMWFFYPDTRAYKAEFYCGGKLLLTLTLKEHSGLNGAYTLKGLPTGSEVKPTGETKDLPTENTEAEQLGNYVLQSDVDNPFTFNASGYVRVGQGEIIGLAGLTTALSQDAFKVATTICFTTQGIWAMKIDSEGAYAEVPPPFSREVCINADTITMTDNAVFFASKKGLMCVTGTNEANVICVSEALKHNKIFHSLLQDASTMIAYDYRDSMIFVVSCKENVKSWAYNIKAGIWSTISHIFGKEKSEIPMTVVNDYPDNIVEDSRYNLYSFYKKPLPEDDEENYDGELKSRAIKLDGSLIPKSLRQIKHLKILNSNCKFTFTIEGKNDATNDWVSVESLKGKAWRFFRLGYKFTDMKATDVFSGTVALVQQRYYEKFR